jgi:hypothetical protein
VNSVTGYGIRAMRHGEDVRNDQNDTAGNSSKKLY